MRSRIIRDALLYFAVSRALLFVLLIAGSQIAFLGKAYSGSIWETRIELQRARVAPELVRVAMVGDAWWYRSVALRGYDSPGAAAPNWAFFPLYPLLVRTLRITGDFALDGIIVSNAAFAAALALLGAVLSRTGASPEEASRAMFYLAFFPTSYFCSLPMTESLFLALSLGAVAAGLTGRWWLAGVLGGLSALTRAPGILLLIPLLIIYFESRPRQRWQIAWLALIPAGLGLFMWHLSTRAGDALAFVHAQRQWGRLSSAPWTPLVEFAAHPNVVSTPWNPVALNLAAGALLVAAVVFFLMRRQWWFAAYTGASLLLPTSTGSVQSLARYAVVIFPLFAFLGILGRRESLDRAIGAACVTLFGALIVFVVLRVDFALA